MRIRLKRPSSKPTKGKSPRTPLSREDRGNLLNGESSQPTKVDITAGMSPDDLAELTSQLEAQIWAGDYALWIEERCKEHVWSKQREICKSVIENRKTIVKSCHSSGKSFIAARVAAAWLCNHKPGEAFVVSSAPTGRQVRAILWREIGRIHAKANLPGRTNQTEWFMETSNGNEEPVAFGMKPDDMSPTAFQGIHARFVLVLFDEACGIATALWDAADSLISNENSRFLGIGNPDDPETEFFEACKPGSGYNVITISAFDTPNFTQEPVPDLLREMLVSKTWVEEKKRKWGEDNPLYISKVLGEFPVTTVDGLIPLKWIRQAQMADLKPSLPNELGCDIGGGGDPNIIAQRRGPVVRIIKKDTEPDTMRTCGHIVQALHTTGASVAKVDVIGIGRGVVNRGRELNEPIIGVNASGKPSTIKKPLFKYPRPVEPPDKEFENLRAEGFWNLRTLFQDGQIDIDPDDDDLAAELAALKYEPNSSGLIQIIKKKKLREILGRSPNEADAIMMAMLNVDTVQVKRKAIWGASA